MKVRKRVLASVLSVALLLTLVPSNLFGATNMGNSTANPFSGGIVGAGSADTAVTDVSQHGYQVNIWAFTEKTSDGEFDWTQGTKVNKSGDMHLKMQDVAYTPDWWLEGGIYEQTTLDYTYYDMLASYIDHDFNYTIWDTTPKIGWSAVNSLNAEIETLLESALVSDPTNLSALQWLDYLDNIDGETLQEFGFSMAYTYNENNRPSGSGFTEVSSDSNALISYFSQPAVIQELFSIATDFYGAPNISVYDFYNGIYNGQEAVYKIEIQPEIWRNLDNTLVPYTFTDASMFPDTYNGDCSSVVVRLHLPLYWNATSAMALVDPEEYLITPDGYLGQNGFSWGQATADQLDTTSKNASNTLGIGVITSPTFGEVEIYPQLVKTYVQVTEVHADGSYEFEYVGESTVETLTSSEDYLTIDGELTNIPANWGTSETVELATADGETVTGLAVLNDSFTSSLYGVSSAEWIDSELPVIDGEEVAGTAQYINTYNFGRVTNLSVAIDSYDSLSSSEFFSQLSEDVSELDAAYAAGTVSNTDYVSYLNSILSNDYFAEYMYELLEDVAEWDGSLNIESSMSILKYVVDTVYNGESVDDLLSLFMILSDSEMAAMYTFGKTLLSEYNVSDCTFTSYPATSNLDYGIGVMPPNSKDIVGVAIDSTTGLNSSNTSINPYSTMSQKATRGTYRYTDTDVLFAVLNSIAEKVFNIYGSVWNELGCVYTDEELYIDVDAGSMIPANSLILRYILLPDATINHLVKVVDVDGESINEFVLPAEPLPLDGTTVTIEAPDLSDVKGADGLEEYEKTLKEWVTNITTPEIDMGELGYELPEMSSGGKTGTETRITDYPVADDDNITTHHLYVEWEIVIEEEVVEYEYDTDGVHVPQWRLSLYADEVTPTANRSYPAADQAQMYFSLRTSCCNLSCSLSDTGTYNFDTVNPNGYKTVAGGGASNMDLSGDVDIDLGVEWLDSRVDTTTSDTVSHTHSQVRTEIDFTVNRNLIKATSEMQKVGADWIDKSGFFEDKEALEAHDITVSNKPENYTGGEGVEIKSATDYLETRSDTFEYNLLNIDTYTHRYKVYGESKESGGHTHDIEETDYTPTSVSYIPVLYDLEATFDVYNQEPTGTPLEVELEVKVENALTSIVYQADSDNLLYVYPEYGMLFDNDNGIDTDIKWIISDEYRTIKPVVYQTIEHKIYVDPTSSGNFVTDSAARAAVTSKFGSEYANLPILYKGGSVNNVFDIYIDKGLQNNAGLMKVKTYAIDFYDTEDDSDKADLKSAWGNEGYNSKELHSTLVSSIDSNDPLAADSTEKLYVESTATYTGGDKLQTSSEYEKLLYNGSDTVELTHNLIIRSGHLIGVAFETANTDGTPLNNNFEDGHICTMEELKTANMALYNALIGMKLYNEEGDKSQTVLTNFVEKDGHTLAETNYATLLAAERASIDGIDTPSIYAAKDGEGWYNEDTTVLVVKEYITNYEVPGISVSDKLPMSVDGLTTPTNVAQYYSAIGKGYTYLRYDMDFDVNYLTSYGALPVYFEYSPVEGTSGTTRIAPDGTTVVLGEEDPTYLVPNVSITDTTW